jgi:2-amino-4-hydroxy-6-hydroxymethyldihydropteridine diphosphokinase
MITAYIGLGSNVDNPIKQIKAALVTLNHLPSSRLLRHSRLYWSESLLLGQARYCNAVAEIITRLTAVELLDELQLRELQQGRVRTEKWEPRIIDLDIILYATQIINTARLQVPHSELMKRDFWLYPLAELTADLVLPGSEIPLGEKLSNELPIGLEVIV